MLLSDEQELIRQTARDFAQAELKPNAAAWDRDAKFPREALEGLGKLGFLGMLVPPELDGAGADHVAYALALMEVAEGDGPVNALDAAMRKALNGDFPGLSDMRLIDYKVRVVNSEAGTAARIRVLIESSDHQDVWGTIGVSENIIEASWRALADSMEYGLMVAH